MGCSRGWRKALGLAQYGAPYCLPLARLLSPSPLNFSIASWQSSALNSIWVLVVQAWELVQWNMVFVAFRVSGTFFAWAVALSAEEM